MVGDEAVAVGDGITVTVKEVSSIQELMEATTEYVVAEVGEIIIEEVVAPVFQT